MSRGVGFGLSCKAQVLADAPRDLGLHVPNLQRVQKTGVIGERLDAISAETTLAERGISVEMDAWPSERGGTVSYTDTPDAPPARGRARLDWLLDNDLPDFDPYARFPGMRRETVTDAGGPPPADMPVAYAERIANPREPLRDEGIPPAPVQDPEFDMYYRRGDGARTDDSAMRDTALEADAARASARINTREQQRTEAWSDVYAWRALPVEERTLRTPLTDSEKQTVRDRYDREVAILNAELANRIDFTSPTLTREIMAKFAAEQRIDRLPDALIAETKLARITPRPTPTPASRVDTTRTEPRRPGERRARELAAREARLRPNPDDQTRIADIQDTLVQQDQNERLARWQDEEAAGLEPGPAPQQYTDTTPYQQGPKPLFNPDAEGAGLPDLAYLDTRPRSRYEAHLVDVAKAYKSRDPLAARIPKVTFDSKGRPTVTDNAGGTLNSVAYGLQPGDVDSSIGFDRPTRDPLDVEQLADIGPTASIRIDEIRTEAATRFKDINGRAPRRVTVTDKDGNKKKDWSKADKPQMESLMREVAADYSDPLPTSSRGITAEDYQASDYDSVDFLDFNPDNL